MIDHLGTEGNIGTFEGSQWGREKLPSTHI